MFAPLLLFVKVYALVKGNTQIILRCFSQYPSFIVESVVIIKKKLNCAHTGKISGFSISYFENLHEGKMMRQLHKVFLRVLNFFSFPLAHLRK